MKDILSSNCEYCKKPIITKYGSGRFCSATCARSFSSQRANTEEKRKQKSISNRRSSLNYFKKQTLEQKNRRIQKYKETRKKQREIRLYRLDKIDLDITYGELEKYRKNHSFCEICGLLERISTSSKKIYSNKLCIDHKHGTNHFRGLLCNDCNKKLGWFENKKESIEKYLNKDR